VLEVAVVRCLEAVLRGARVWLVSWRAIEDAASLDHVRKGKTNLILRINRCRIYRTHRVVLANRDRFVVLCNEGA
jgi:hypothetical protein